MSRSRIALVSLALAACVATPAAAVTLPVSIGLEIRIATIPPPLFTSTGTATLNGSGGGGHLESLAIATSQVAGSTVVPITDPAAAPIKGMQMTIANRAGGLAETVGGTLRGSIGLLGAAKVCLFGTGGCAGAIANLTVPLTVVGDGGFQYSTAAVNLTVIGAPWTTGIAAIGTITEMGFARGPASLASSTAQPSGSIRLVTPLHISTNIAASAVVPIWGVMTMHFVPEPTSIALLGTGIVALALAGTRKV